jgi:hypothetical protein
VAAGFLLNNERHIAAHKIADVLQRYIHEGHTSDPLIRDHKLDGVDFDAVALKLIRAAEIACPMLPKTRLERFPTAQQ